jgi:WD40 repeat protein
MELKSRIEAYITNTNLPWESKTKTHISVGAFFVFKVLFNPEKGFKFEKIYAKSFPEQTGCISWNRSSNTIHIGLDSGRIVFYKLNPESNFTEYEQYIDFRPHKGTVTGIMYDGETGYIYSVSNDKKFCITEVGYLNNQSEILEGPCGFTGLYEDVENHRIFLTNEMGMVFVYLTQNFPPLLVNSLQLSSEAPIKYLDMSLLKSYIFTASSNGQIIVLDINKPGKEKLIKEISNFGGNMKLTVVKYYREQNQLITGDENGRIIIWNLKTGKSIFSWNAHEGPITQMVFLPQIKLIISSGKDKYFRTWRLPDKWQNEDVVKFEQTEIKNISDTMAMLKLQKSLAKPEDYNSDEDSLNGWDYNDEYDP